MKRLLAILLALVLVLSLAACSKTESRRRDRDDDDDDDKPSIGQNMNAGLGDLFPEENANDGYNEEQVEQVQPDDTLSVGFIFIGDENSTYDRNFMDAAKEACAQAGVTMVQKTRIPESNQAYEAAVELIETDGCDIIFANSYGHESYLMKAAREYPDVEFCHAGGVQAHTAGLDNFHNTYASIHQGRYITGVAAGMKLTEMINNGEITTEQAKLGFVGAFTYAEVISAYTAFYLGAKSACPFVTMDVRFTGSWCDEVLEREAALALIDSGCILISQYSDSMGAPTACETMGVPNVPYNGSTAAPCPETYLISTRINWVPIFNEMITCVQNDRPLDADIGGSLWNDAVEICELGANVADGTAERVEEITDTLSRGVIHVFDTTLFTVNGSWLTSYMADVDYDTAFTPDTQVVDSFTFYECTYRSAPYFDVEIDGINLLNRNYG